ncbi:MAG: GntR family transcriptional regulator [Planctomycetota bacterium]
MSELSREKGVPLYEQLENLLRGQIQKGEYNPGDKIATICDLVDEHDVSKITVRRALSDLVKEGYLRAIPGRGTFVRDPSERQAARKDKFVGILFRTKLTEPFMAGIYHGIVEELESHGYWSLLAHSSHNAQVEADKLQEFKEKGVEGVIVNPTPVNRTSAVNDSLSEIIESGTPTVFVDIKVPRFDVDLVTSDNCGGGYLAARHLLDLGHRRIGFIGDVDSSTVRDRLEGYKRALAEEGVSFDELLVKRSYIDFRNEKSGCRNTKELLHMADAPTAIMTSTDSIALGVYQACYELGIEVPDDLSVVGYDNLPYSKSLLPPLTTIDQPKHDMGRKAGELLLDRMQGEEGESREVILDSELVERSSCQVCPESEKVAEGAAVG